MSERYKLSAPADVQVLTLYDLISEYANREILAVAQRRIEQGFANFVVDLGPIEVMNSVGLNFLIMLRGRTGDHGGRIAVANASAKIMQLLEITKLRPLFHVTDSVEEAVRSLKAEA